MSPASVSAWPPTTATEARHMVRGSTTITMHSQSRSGGQHRNPEATRPYGHVARATTPGPYGHEHTAIGATLRLQGHKATWTQRRGPRPCIWRESACLRDHVATRPVERPTGSRDHVATTKGHLRGGLKCMWPRRPEQVKKICGLIELSRRSPQRPRLWTLPRGHMASRACGLRSTKVHFALARRAMFWHDERATWPQGHEYTSTQGHEFC